MAQIPVDYIEVRWRPADTAGAWMAQRMKPGSGPLTIASLRRGMTYQIEARNVGTNGEPSAWTQQTHTINGANQTPLSPTNLTATSGISGNTLAWQIPANQPADVQYDVERCGNNGSQPDGNWVNIQTLKASGYLDPATDGGAYWYRVRSVTFLGLCSDYTSPVELDGTVQPPSNLTLQPDNSTAFTLSDGGSLSRTVASWTPSTDPLVMKGGKTEVQYQMSSATQPSATLNPTQQPDGSWLSAWIAAGNVDSSVTFLLIIPSVEYTAVYVRVRAVRPNGATSVWVSNAPLGVPRPNPPGTIFIGTYGTH